MFETFKNKIPVCCCHTNTVVVGDFSWDDGITCNSIQPTDPITHTHTQRNHAYCIVRPRPTSLVNISQMHVVYLFNNERVLKEIIRPREKQRWLSNGFA